VLVVSLERAQGALHDKLFINGEQTICEGDTIIFFGASNVCIVWVGQSCAPIGRKGIIVYRRTFHYPI
jgi:hypothetical protein